LNVTKSKGSLSAKGWPEGTKKQDEGTDVNVELQNSVNSAPSNDNHFKQTGRFSKTSSH
jgi:hypothetical protein